MSGVAVISDLSVGSSVKLNVRDIAPAWRAKWLDRGVDRLNRKWVACRKIRVEGARIGSESGYLDAQDWIASHHTCKTASVAVSYGEDTSGVDAVSLGEVRD